MTRSTHHSHEADMDHAKIIEGIAQFPRWHYEFDLEGHKTPIFDEGGRSRHQERKKYFFDPLVKLLGGSLAGKRVLDLGCNAGFWSLCAVESGCSFVLGIDGRRMHIEQAEFVFDAKGVDPNRYEFRCADVFDALNGDLGKFDVVLCLGLLYHVSKPVTLLELIVGLDTDILVVDSTLSKQAGSAFEVGQESLDDPRNAVDRELVLVPTRTAVLSLVRHFGYRAVVLKPQFADYSGAVDYRENWRRAFMCAKHTELGSLEVEPDVLPLPSEPIPAPPTTTAADFSAAELVRAVCTKAARKLRSPRRV
jgi:2-polyprenyl-3-methyl-5-hydroxy-6-metoxy-1,4-benzoquinol methylase